MADQLTKNVKSPAYEIERVLLAACLRSQENVPIVINNLKAEDFFNQRSKDLFRAIKSLYKRGLPVDPLSLLSELKTHGRDILPSEILEMEDHFIDGLSLDYHIGQLKAFSRRRRLEITLEEALTEVEDLSVEYPELEEGIIQRITAILNDKPVVARKKPGIDLTLTTLEEVYQYEEPHYLIEPVVIEGTVNLFGSGAGKGKSLVTLSIIRSILTGDPLWGRYPVITAGSVLLVDEETPRPFLRKRIEQMGFDKTLPFYFLHFQDVRLDGDAFFDALLKKIDQVKPVFIVFDSLIRIHRQPEGESVLMASVMGRLRKIANTGPTVWIIHHHKKGDAPLDQKARGSSDIVAGVDIEYGMVAAKDGFLKFSSVKTRVEPFGPIRLKLETSDNQIGVVYAGTETESIIQEVVEILRYMGPLRVKDLFEELKVRGIEVGENRLREILKSPKEFRSEKVKDGRTWRWVYSLNDSQTSPLTTLHASPPYKRGGEAGKRSVDVQWAVQ
jgi:hypothetical protein